MTKKSNFVSIVAVVDRPQLGRGRRVPPNSFFHASVKLLEDDPKLKYKPVAHYDKSTITYVT